MSIGSAWAADAAEVQKCPTGRQSSTLKGEPLWECVKTALLAMRGSSISSSIIVFDWDDTLFPTTSLCTSGHLPKVGLHETGSAAQDREFDSSVPPELASCFAAAVQTLRAAKSFGNRLIVTNSDHGWVHDTAARFSPTLARELKDIPVISARSIFEPAGIKDGRQWKVLCFRRIVECSHAGAAGIWGVQNLVSIGDSLDEREATMKTAQSCPCYVKSVKLMQQPTIVQLTQQLEMCSSQIGQIAYYMGNLDLNLVRESSCKLAEASVSENFEHVCKDTESAKKKQRLMSWADRGGA
jgi:hypothetical protein